MEYTNNDYIMGKFAEFYSEYFGASPYEADGLTLKPSAAVSLPMFKRIFEMGYNLGSDEGYDEGYDYGYEQASWKYT